MEIKFNKLKITNFRNINELEIDFKDGITEIVASNGKGKTNTLSAIMWCLFGKNIYEAKQFPISPIIDGVERNDITTNVKMIINNNYIVSRSYFNRKTNLQTGYLIDGKEELVSVTQTQFNEELKNKLVDEETFRSLSNINYLPNLNWKDLKEYIFDLIGDIKDEEVILKGDFKLVEEQIRLMGINNTSESLIKSDKALNEQIKSAEVEYQTTLNIKDSLVADNAEEENLLKRKAEIEKEIATSKEEEVKKEQLRKEYAEKNSDISKKELEIDSILRQIEIDKDNIKEYESLYKNLTVDVEVLREQEIADIRQKQVSINSNIINLQKMVETRTEELEELRNIGNSLKEKEIKVENEVCNTCGQKLPQEKIEETLNKLKQDRDELLKSTKDKYDSLKKVIETDNEFIEKETKELENLNNLINEIKVKEYEISDESEKQKEIRIKKELLETECLKKVEQQIALESELADLKMEFSKMEIPDYNTEDITPLLLELDKINEKLSTTITLSSLSDKLKDIDNKLNDLKKQKNIVKEKLNEVAQFNNLKADLVREKARSKFNIVDFKTREFTQDGTEVETFKICIDGIDYKELNTGMKILVAIDLVNGIQKIKDIKIPVILDNAENVTNDISIEGTQLIMARAVKNIEKIEIK